MTLTLEQQEEYLQQARKEDGMHTVPDNDYLNFDPEEPIIAQANITGRRQVRQSLSIKGPTPINPITRKDAIFSINEATQETKLFPTQDKPSLTQDLPYLSITQAKRSIQTNRVGDNFEPDDQTTLKSHRPHKTIGYTRHSRLTPKQNRKS